MIDVPSGFQLEFADDFRGTDLDRTKWIPFYLPQWSSRAAAAAHYETGESGLILSIAPNQEPWFPEFDGDVRVSSLQTGLFSGPFGSAIGQHRFKPGLCVRESQAEERLYVPRHGYFEMRARMEVHFGQLAALWMIGFEDRPEWSGEITIMEIFGDSVDTESAVLGHGIKAINDSNLVDEFHATRLAFSPAEFHIYAVEWDEDGVAFFFDHALLHRTTQSPAYPMQFMLNVYELKPGAPSLPRLEVDYFRGYHRV